MKKVLIVLFALNIIGCSSTQSVDHWQGAKLSNLIQEYGVPANYLRLGDGSTIVEFTQESNNLASNYCTISFVVDRSNTVLGGKGKGTKGKCVS